MSVVSVSSNNPFPNITSQAPTQSSVWVLEVNFIPRLPVPVQNSQLLQRNAHSRLWHCLSLWMYFIYYYIFLLLFQSPEDEDKKLKGKICFLSFPVIKVNNISSL